MPIEEPAVARPRIYLRRGIWVCRRPGDTWPMGHGYTIKSAWDDWAEQMQVIEHKSRTGARWE